MGSSKKHKEKDKDKEHKKKRKHRSRSRSKERKRHRHDRDREYSDRERYRRDDDYHENEDYYPRELDDVDSKSSFRGTSRNKMTKVLAQLIIGVKRSDSICSCIVVNIVLKIGKII